jgi:RecB family exonuclease
MVQETLPEEEYDDFFEGTFGHELGQLGDPENLRENLVNDMLVQAKKITPHIIPGLVNSFGEYEVFSVEEKLFEKINDFSLDKYTFKGYIDLVLKTSDGKYHIIDWKTCSWGWDARKRTDRLVTYQLTLYKNYFCQKHGIDPSLVETHFALLKRTAKKDNVEIFRVTSGKRKTENAMALLHRALHNICKSNNIKNRLSCQGCEHYKTKHCP